MNLRTLLDERIWFINDTFKERENTDEVDVKNWEDVAAGEMVGLWGILAAKMNGSMG